MHDCCVPIEGEFKLCCRCVLQEDVRSKVGCRLWDFERIGFMVRSLQPPLGSFRLIRGIYLRCARANHTWPSKNPSRFADMFLNAGHDWSATPLQKPRESMLRAMWQKAGRGSVADRRCKWKCRMHQSKTINSMHFGWARWASQPVTPL